LPQGHRKSPLRGAESGLETAAAPVPQGPGRAGRRLPAHGGARRSAPTAQGIGPPPRR